MNKILTLLFFLLATTFAFAQTTQTGYVKTKGRMDSKGNLIPGTRIGGVAIQLTGGHSTVADANGDFTLTAPDKKFYLSDVQKQGYVLTDPDMLKKQYACSSNPLVISMETKEKLADDQLAAERKLRRQLQKQLQQKEEEIDALKEENKITEEEYRQALQKLYADQESNEKLVSEMAKRYAEIDYDLLDEFYRQVSFSIENGDLVKADSLLRSRGDVSQQIKDAQKKAQALNEEKEKMQQAEAVLAADIEELGRRCYGFYEKFAAQYKNDSAAYYLELRANLDTTNVGWQLEAGKFIQEYLADYNKGLTYYQRALRQALAQNGEKHHDVAICYNSIGTIYVDMGDYKKGIEFYQKALAIQQSVYGENNPDVAQSYHDMGMGYSYLGEYKRAMEYYQKALDLRKSVCGESHPDVMDSYLNFGAFYAEQGEFESALDYFQKALSIGQTVYGEEHPEVAPIYHNIGLVYSNFGNYDQALEYIQKCLAILKSVYGEEHPDVANTYISIAVVYYDQQEYLQALEYYSKVLAIRKSILGEHHPDVAQTYVNMGLAYSCIGEDNLALECHRKALAIQLPLLGENHRDVASAYTGIGFAYLNLRDYVQSLEYNQKALSIRIMLFGEGNPYVALCENSIAEVYDAKGDYDQAKEYYKKASTILKSYLGADFPLVVQIENNITFLQKKKIALDPAAMQQYVYTLAFDAEVSPGFSGEYVVLECDQWSVESQESLFIFMEGQRGKSTTVLMMKDDVILHHTFENGIDVPIDLKKIGKKEKARIMGLYQQNK